MWKKIYEETQKNLEQFYAPEQTEIDLIFKNLIRISLKNILISDKKIKYKKMKKQ